MSLAAMAHQARPLHQHLQEGGPTSQLTPDSTGGIRLRQGDRGGPKRTSLPPERGRTVGSVNPGSLVTGPRSITTEDHPRTVRRIEERH